MTDLERLQKLARDVRLMRKVQNQFFAGDRSSGVLHEAKSLERHVDRLVAEILDVRPTLFGDEFDG